MAKKARYNLDAKQVILAYDGLDDFYKYLAGKGIVIKEINPKTIDKYTNAQIIKMSPEEKGNSFDSADKLYKLCSRKNSKTKIIYDAFSITKAREIYDNIIELETCIRQGSAEIMLKNGHSVGRNYRKARSRSTISIKIKRKLPDYEVSQTTLDTLIHHVLLSTGAPRIIDKLRLRKAKPDLILLHDARNKVMHANVITDAQFDKYKKSIESIDTAIRNSLDLDLLKYFTNWQDSKKKLQ